MSDRDAPLSPEQIRELREELERELTRLERSMKRTSEAAKPVELDQTSVGRLSRMDALQNQHLTAGLHERGQVRHLALVTALERIEKGAYGRCTACGRSIPFGRLLVLPEATTCAGCGGR